MKKGLIIGILVAGIIAYQIAFIEKLEEKKKEEKFSDVSKLPPASVIPSYLGTLMLGPFKAIATDILWLSYDKASEKRKIEEAMEILELISRLEVCNEEVLVMICWDLAYNLPVVFEPQDKESIDIIWKCYKFGLQTARDAVDKISESPYLKYHLAYTLMHKVSYLAGHFEESIIKRFEQDVALKHKIMDGVLEPKKIDEATIFDCAIAWFFKARDQIREIAGKVNAGYAALGGLYIRDSILDIYIANCMYYNFIRFWRDRNLVKAISELENLIQHMEYTIQTYKYFEHYREHLEFYRDLLDVVKWEGHERHPSECLDPHCLTCYEKLRKLDILLRKYGGRIAFMLTAHIYSMATPLKQALTNDMYEYNDNLEVAQHITDKAIIRASISPDTFDRDYFVIEKEGSSPKKIDITFINKSGTPLQFRIIASGKDILLQQIASGQREKIVFKADLPGVYYLLIESVSQSTGTCRADYEFAISIQ